MNFQNNLVQSKKNNKNLNLISLLVLDNHIIVLIQVWKLVDIKLIQNIYIIELMDYINYNKKMH